MKIDGKIIDEKKQYGIKSEAAKTCVLPLGKTDKYEYVMGELIFSSDQVMTIEQAIFTYSPSGKTLKNKWEQLKAIEENKLKFERF